MYRRFESYHPSQAKLPQTFKNLSAGRCAGWPHGLPRSGGSGAPPGEPDGGFARGASEQIEVDPSRPVLPVVALFIRLRAQREVLGVDAEPVEAAVADDPLRSEILRLLRHPRPRTRVKKFARFIDRREFRGLRKRQSTVAHTFGSVR